MAKAIPSPAVLSPPRSTAEPICDGLGLRIADVAQLLGISTCAVYYLRSRGQLPPPDRMLGRLPVWSRKTVEAWVEQGEVRDDL